MGAIVFKQRPPIMCCVVYQKTYNNDGAIRLTAFLALQFSVRNLLCKLTVVPRASSATRSRWSNYLSLSPLLGFWLHCFCRPSRPRAKRRGEPSARRISTTSPWLCSTTNPQERFFPKG